MGTRSAIGIEEGGKITAVYCHWDGYLASNGKLLIENYREPELRRLLSLGSLSSLGESIDPNPNAPHSFDKQQDGVCTFYGRDRGETDQEATTIPAGNHKKLGDTFVGEYYYVMKEGVWHVSQGAKNDWRILSEALKEAGIGFTEKTAVEPPKTRKKTK